MNSGILILNMSTLLIDAELLEKERIILSLKIDAIGAQLDGIYTEIFKRKGELITRLLAEQAALAPKWRR